MEDLHHTYVLLKKEVNERTLPPGITTALKAVLKTMEDRLGITDTVATAVARKNTELAAQKPYKGLYNSFVF